MDEALVIDIGRQALFTVLKVIAPLVGFGLVAGLTVAIFQATTQIQEQTLAFIPKILAVIISAAIFGPWILNTMIDFITNLFTNIPQYVG